MEALFIVGYEESMLETFEKKAMIWWKYLDDIIFIFEPGKESLKFFIDQINMFCPTAKFNAEYSKEERGSQFFRAKHKTYRWGI